MLKKTITYTDYNGDSRTEDFYFNLSKAEVMELNMSTSGGLVEMVYRITNTQDAPAIIKVFKELVLKAYGERSLDGKRFMKKGPHGESLANAFAETEAYSVLFMELVTSADAAAAFFNAIIPEPEKPTTPAPAIAE